MRVSDAVLVGLVGIAIVTFFALRGVPRLSWSDEIVYAAMGCNVAAGRGLTSNFYDPRAILADGFPLADVHMPGHALALAVSFAALGCREWAAIGVSQLAFILTGLILFRAAERVESRRAGALAAALYYVFPPAGFLERADRPRSVVLFFGFDDLHSNVTPTAGRPHLALDGERLVLRPARPFAPAASSAVRRWHGSVALRLLSDALATAHPGIHRRLAAIGLAAPLDRPPPPIEPYGPRNEAVRQMWRTTEAILKTLKQELEARNSRLVIFYVPARFEIDLAAWDLAFKHYRMGRRHWRPDRVFNTLRSAGARLGVPIVDPRQSLKQAESRETPTYREDGLWTERGRAVAAEALAPILTVHACSESAGSKDHLSRR